ncbi:MAG: adenosylcobinamide-GDP ribazoletransferase [Acaryochloridaceae cyanobacterium SU_2_1]|nr:adenosylcobinamide-GDP ribazoletransferase [Acaryochloridaceae cyanobacterium SU_2_1]
MKQILQEWGGAISFYSCLSLPATWALDYQRIARWAPLVGVVIGGLLSLLDYGCYLIHLPVLTRSAVVVGAWLSLTGGLHLDGVMDTADGLGVMDQERRLEAMSDSRTGAFGVMGAIIVVLLKVSALSEISGQRAWLIVTAIIWGRWAQVVAIAAFPALKAEGMGASHTHNFQRPQDLLPGIGILLGLSLSQYLWQPLDWQWVIWGTLMGNALVWTVNYWFYHQLGGMTGDVYGAIVEWTEAFLLCGLTLISQTTSVNMS